MTSLLLGALLLLTNGQSINFFSLKQDVEIGSESAKEAEQSLPLVRDVTLNGYFRAIGQRLTQNRPPALQYRFRIVNSKEVNSLGFPGGAIYVYRGLLDMAANDDEVAAIIAHEIAHISSRHGTAQLSRQLVVQAPVAIAAGLSATEAWKEQLGKLGISLGINAPFLRYSRDQELEASLTAIKLMADARFDPNSLRTLREKMNEAQTVDSARLQTFVFNHPQPETLSPEIAETLEKFSTPARHARATAEFRQFRSSIQKLVYPAVLKTPAADSPTDAIGNIYTHPQEFYRLGYPMGWQVTRTTRDGAIIAPPDGVQFSRNGEDLTRGVMFDMFDVALPARSLKLEQATDRLMVFLKQRNDSIRIVPGAQTQILVSDEPALRTVIIGKSTATNSSEVAWVVTRLYFSSLFYMVFVAPEDEFAMYQPIFEQMIRSARLR